MGQFGQPADVPLLEAEAPQRTGRVVGRWVLISLLGLAVWAGVFNLVLFVLPGAKPERVWSAAGGTPPPSDFLYLMFPVDDNVALFDSPGGKKVGLLRRALGNDFGEMTSRQWISVPPDEAGAKTMYVRAEDLRYLSAAVAGTAPPVSEQPLNERVNYVAAFAASYRSRAPGERRQVRYMAYSACPAELAREGTIGGEGRYVSLDLKSGKNRRQFFARVTADKATPLAIDRIAEGSTQFYTVARWVLAGCVATVASGLTVVASGGLRRRPDGGKIDRQSQFVQGGSEPT